MRKLLLFSGLLLSLSTNIYAAAGGHTEEETSPTCVRFSLNVPASEKDFWQEVEGIEAARGVREPEAGAAAGGGGAAGAGEPAATDRREQDCTLLRHTPSEYHPIVRKMAPGFREAAREIFRNAAQNSDALNALRDALLDEAYAGGRASFDESREKNKKQVRMQSWRGPWYSQRYMPPQTQEQARKAREIEAQVAENSGLVRYVHGLYKDLSAKDKKLHRIYEFLSKGRLKVGGLENVQIIGKLLQRRLDIESKIDGAKETYLRMSERHQRRRESPDFEVYENRDPAWVALRAVQAYRNQAIGFGPEEDREKSIAFMDQDAMPDLARRYAAGVNALESSNGFKLTEFNIEDLVAQKMRCAAKARELFPEQEEAFVQGYSVLLAQRDFLERWQPVIEAFRERSRVLLLADGDVGEDSAWQDELVRRALGL